MAKLIPITLPNNGSGKNIGTPNDLVREFWRRLDAYFTYYNVVVTGFGYRSIEKQAEMYLAWINDPAHNNQAAYPGKSWHNVGCSYDVNSVNDKYPATMEADYLLAPTKQAMNKWGLCIPMWSGSSAKEPWHIQPIETLGYSTPQRYLAEDDYVYHPDRIHRMIYLVNIAGWSGTPVFMEGADVQRFQRALSLPQTGIFNGDCDTAARNLQRVNNLTVDGKVGKDTWPIVDNIISNMTPPPDYKALYEEEVKKNETLTQENDQLEISLTNATNDATAKTARLKEVQGYLRALSAFEDEEIL